MVYCELLIVLGFGLKVAFQGVGWTATSLFQSKVADGAAFACCFCFCQAWLEGEIFIDNLLVRVHLLIEMSRPVLRHGSLNSLFQVALYLPS